MVSLSLDTPELAAKYDVVGQRQFSHGKLLVNDLGIKAGERVLDVGTGTGLLAAYVAGIVGPAGQVVAIDPLPLRIELAKQKAPAHLQALVGNAEDLSAFSPNSFDVVYLNSVIHWIHDKPRVLAEICRVLKPGGRVGFTTAAKDQPHDVEVIRQRALRETGLTERASASDGIPFKVTSADVRQLFEQGGFRTKQIEVRTIVDYQASAADVHEASLSSSFGNSHLGQLSEAERERVHSAFAVELEKRRDGQGIRLERHLIFAVAEKVQTS
jgi:arsenite methyltransferase